VDSNFLDQLDLLSAGRVIDTALKHTTTMAVRSHSNTIFTDSIEDELKLFIKISNYTCWI
jgi:hypothetical protein